MRSGHNSPEDAGEIWHCAGVDVLSQDEAGSIAGQDGLA
jgi:hypothetical protein